MVKLPLQITTRNVSISEIVKNDIRKKAEKLEQFSEQIINCHVTVDTPHRHHHQGVQYQVSIDITVPGSELVVNHRHDEDVYVAIRDAFNAARRQLEAFERRPRGKTKVPEVMPQSTVNKLFVEDNFGFIASPNGYDVYFHQNSIRNGSFNEMTIGTEVRYLEEEGEKGPQASTVILI